MSQDHWIMKGLSGVNILTLVGVALAAASLYYQLDKDIALMQRDIDAIEHKLSRIERRLISQGKSMPYAWPSPTQGEGKG